MTISADPQELRFKSCRPDSGAELAPRTAEAAVPTRMGMS
jgi:hypothetical protein